MSDVFRARFDGREWWAEVGAYASTAEPYRADLFITRDMVSEGLNPTYTVPAHMVERVEDLPPEPTEPGTVLYFDKATAIRKDGAWLICLPPSWVWASLEWSVLIRTHGEPHAYPRAARDEIEALRDDTRRLDDTVEQLTRRVEALTGERDEFATKRDEYEAEKDAAWVQVEQLQRWIDRALDWFEDSYPAASRILRGEA